MLNVRIGQLTFGDFHPTRSAALPAAHKAEEPDPATAGFRRYPPLHHDYDTVSSGGRGGAGVLLLMLKQDDFTMTGKTVPAHFYLRMRNRPYVLFALYELINPCDRAATFLSSKMHGKG